MENEKNFLKPIAEIVEFRNDDVIFTSGEIVEYDENGLPIIP